MIPEKITGRRYAQLKCINRYPSGIVYEGKERPSHIMSDSSNGKGSK